jgi:hypothetical protein
MTNLPIRLVYPPQGHFTQPYLALPCIKAWLHQQGFDDVGLVDASIEAYDRFLSPDYLARAKRLVEERLPLARYEGEASLSFDQLAAYRGAAEVAASADAVIEAIEEAKRTIRGEGFYDVDRYTPAVRTLYQGLRIVSAAHHPSELTPHNFTMRYSNERSSEVLAATRDEVENPFIEHFRATLLPRLVADKVRVVGMSVIYGSQLVPALTLGRLIKEALPDCHVTAGGGFLAYIGRKLMRAPGIDACLDSLVFHEGEGPMAALCAALRDGSPLESVGSLTWFKRVDGRIETIENPPMHPVRLDAAPTPDFDGLPFHLYFSPRLVLPYDINRGCYYGECTFCTLPTVIGPGYRTRRASTIAEHVVALRDKHRTTHFNFITDCMPPGMIRDLPDELIAREAGVTWWSDARVEPKAYTLEGARKLHDAGCRKLLFGFETATPRLLKMMQKGQSLKSTVEVARNCAAAGISVTFYAMVGFPTETREEARATLQFLLDHKDAVREVSLQTFHIDEVAQTYHEPGKFGIRIIDDPSKDIELYHDYEAASGMSQKEAAEMFEEMMAGLRANLPIFAGDNIFFFMQKSHYFLHLAAGTSPDEFARRARERAERRSAERTSLAWRPARGLRPVRLSHPHAEVVRAMARPEARAVRPDFLTGRHEEGALQAAVAAIPPVERSSRVLWWCGETAEFVETRPDGAAALRALQAAGNLSALLERLPPTDETGRAALLAFARELKKGGALVEDSSTSAGHGATRRDEASSTT